MVREMHFVGTALASGVSRYISTISNGTERQCSVSVNQSTDTEDSRGGDNLLSGDGFDGEILRIGVVDQICVDGILWLGRPLFRSAVKGGRVVDVIDQLDPRRDTGGCRDVCQFTFWKFIQSICIITNDCIIFYNVNYHTSPQPPVSLR